MNVIQEESTLLDDIFFKIFLKFCLLKSKELCNFVELKTS